MQREVMKPRRDRRPEQALSLKAFYTVPELAGIAGVHRVAMRRMLQRANVPIVDSGRAAGVVMWTSLEERLPDLVNSIIRVQEIRGLTG